MNLDDMILSSQAADGNHEEVAERAQAIKFVLRQGRNWNRMSIPNKEALEHIAALIGVILTGHLEDEAVCWNAIACAARMRGSALELKDAQTEAEIAVEEALSDPLPDALHDMFWNGHSMPTRDQESEKSGSVTRKEKTNVEAAPYAKVSMDTTE